MMSSSVAATCPTGPAAASPRDAPRPPRLRRRRANAASPPPPSTDNPSCAATPAPTEGWMQACCMYNSTSAAVPRTRGRGSCAGVCAAGQTTAAVAAAEGLGTPTSAPESLASGAAASTAGADTPATGEGIPVSLVALAAAGSRSTGATTLAVSATEVPTLPCAAAPAAPASASANAASASFRSSASTAASTGLKSTSTTTSVSGGSAAITSPDRCRPSRVERHSSGRSSARRSAKPDSGGPPGRSASAVGTATREANAVRGASGGG